MKKIIGTIIFSLLIIGCVTSPPSVRDLTAIRQNADNGDSKAQAEMGFSYQYGDGVTKDAQKALIWNLKSANQGNPMAQHNLAVMYDEGVDIPRDKTLAVKWYQKAAEQGHPRAQLNLGVMYWKGDGVEKNVKRGWDLLNHVRMTSPTDEEKWAARRVLDTIKNEIGVDSSKIGPLDYPDWEMLQKATKL